MPVAKQPELDKALKYRAHLDGRYEVGQDGVLLSHVEDDNYILEEGETRYFTLDCDITLIQKHAPIAFVQYHPSLYQIGTLTGPSTISGKDNRITFRFESDIDLDLSELPYIVKVVFEGIY